MKRPMTRREWSDELCRRLHRHVAAAAPKGLGHWDRAWELVEEPSHRLLDLLAEFERNGGQELKERAAVVATEVLRAWEAAALEWEQAGRPVPAELTPA